MSTVRVTAETEVFCDRASDSERDVHAGLWPLQSLRATCEHGSLVEFDLAPIAAAVKAGETEVSLKQSGRCVEPHPPYREHALFAAASVNIAYDAPNPEGT